MDQTVSLSTANLFPLFKNVRLKIVDENLQVLNEYAVCLDLKVNSDVVNGICILEFNEPESFKNSFTVRVSDASHFYQCGTNVILFRISQGSAVVTLGTQNDMGMLLHLIQSTFDPGNRKTAKQSVFSLRTEEASAFQYFQFYGYLSQQQNMMQDYVRTSTYQAAMLQNTVDFKDKVVIDVGAGSGILSFFAVQAGAKKVYAIEASSMAVYCQKLVRANKLSNKILVIAGKVEEIDIPEFVDVIVSEPMGYMLFNERMLESYIHARKWLKPDGKMFPTQAVLYSSPFNDEMLYMEQYNKVSFWCQQHFHGVDLSSLRDSAMEEYFKQPVVDTFDARILMAKPFGYPVDFKTTSESSLHVITFPVSYTLYSTGSIHGLAFWFDVIFSGSQQTIWLSTAPVQPVTHWYQIRCVFSTPLFASAGQEVTGHIYMKANERQSYDIEIELKVNGTSQVTRARHDLKNPYFRYTGSIHQPSGYQHTNPTENYWSQATQSNQTGVYPQQDVVMNGSSSTSTSYSITTVHPLTSTSSVTTGLNTERQMWYPEQSNNFNFSMYYQQKIPCSLHSNYLPLSSHS